MSKQVTVTFDFDETLGTVSNLKCVMDGIEKKKRTTKKQSDVIEELASEAVIKLEPNKLVFNNKAVADMELSTESRIVIMWEQEPKNKKKLFPVIGTDIAFDDEGAGNKMTKTFTVQYKGKQNTLLAELGTEFGIEEYKDGIWRLVSKDGGVKTQDSVETIKSISEKAEKIDPELIVEGDETFEIDDLEFNL